ncbi:thiazole synthase [Salinibius halmophilus]|uniref:thiazole synthase n=1 Tax=Salinibius halmophilus TaxID=1853216 RepID=UPI000E66BD68|nr:thiazole synthase [Salinibius halmophilus]
MLTIAEQSFTSRLFVGTGKFSSQQQMQSAITASGSNMATLALRRIDLNHREGDVLAPLQQLNIQLLPNTSGARTAKEAISAALIARELLATNWVKLEIHPNSHHLLPDPMATVSAAEALVKLGFIVLPYCFPDPLLCQTLAEVGCAAVMPLAAPIGSNKGVTMPDMLAYIIEDSPVPVVIDAGLGKPSDAAIAMEMGADAVLVNTAIATAPNPAAMAACFAQAVKTGRKTYEIGYASQSGASASSPLTAFFNHA